MLTIAHFVNFVRGFDVSWCGVTLTRAKGVAAERKATREVNGEQLNASAVQYSDKIKSRKRS